jgi:hypothetical protein
MMTILSNKQTQEKRADLEEKKDKGKDHGLSLGCPLRNEHSQINLPFLDQH